MAITITELDFGYDNGDHTVYGTTLITPAANSLIIFPYDLRHATAAPGGTASAGSGTWVETVPEQVTGDGLNATGLWISQQGASPGTFNPQLTTKGGVTATALGYSLLQVTGHDTTTPIAASYLGPATGSGVTSATLTFSALTNANNAQIAFFTHRANEAQTAEAGWSFGTADFNINPNGSALAEWLIAGSDLTAGMSWTTSARYTAVGVEINIAGAGGASLDVPLLRPTPQFNIYRM